MRTPSPEPDRRRVHRVALERLTLLLEGTGVAIFEWDAATDSLRWSPDLGLLWGRERGWQPSGYAEYLETVHPEDRPGLEECVAEALRTGRPYEIEIRAMWPDGPPRWVHVRTVVERDEEGRPATLIGLVNDAHARRLRELAADFLSRTGLALSQSLDVEEMLAEVARLAVPELAEWCAFHVVAADGRLETLAVAHEDPEMVATARELERRYPPAEGSPTGAHAVARTGNPELYPVISAQEIARAAVDEEHLRLLRELAMGSAMIVPIVAHGAPLGAITFVAGVRGPTYGTDDLELACEVGRRVGLALDNARTHARLEQVQAVTDVALAHLERQDMLDELLRRICDLLGGDFAIILLLDTDAHELRVEAVLGLEPDDVEGARIPLGRGVAGTVAAEGRPRIFADLSEVDVQSRHLRERGRSTVAAPLLVDGDVIGVIHVSSSQPYAFEPADVELLELVAERAARVIAHARVYEETRDTALALQRALLPSRLADVPGATVAARYLPGQRTLEIGGDWYDVLPLPDGRYGLVVGDVMGRGVQAAAVMGRLRSAVRAYLHSERTPAAALARLDSLIESSDEVTFATLCLVAYSPASGAYQLASAGHLPPVLREAGADSARTLEAPLGPPLGTGTPPRGNCGGVLQPGEMLVVYTDGLLEIRGTDIGARLQLLCSSVAAAPDNAEAAAEHLLDAMLGSPRAARDDTALLVVRRDA